MVLKHTCQLQKHFLKGTKFGDLFGASSEAPEQGFWGPFGVSGRSPRRPFKNDPE